MASMIRYKNTSVTAKTFYGTQFKSGEEHDVPGYINDPSMIRVGDKPKELPKVATKKAPAPVVSDEVSDTSKSTKETK